MKEKLNMREWKESVIRSPYKKGCPVLSYPSVQLMDVTVKKMLSNSSVQAKGMKMIADRCPSLASLSMMDLTLEAELFGAEVRLPENDVPDTIDGTVKTLEDAQNLRLPKVGEGRTQNYIDAIKEACELITDRPVFAGIVGPFTLLGRLTGAVPALKFVKKNPELIHTVMEKATDFIIEYAKAYKEQTGANGFVMAEPLTGLLSPKMAIEFSEPYCKKIIDAVQDEYFICVYHNCGNSAINMAESIARLGAEGYHFGNVINLHEILPLMPDNSLIMGNVDPSNEFCMSDAENMKAKTTEILEKCCYYPNFVPSSGCDIAPIAKWENIDAFYEAIEEFYTSKGIPGLAKKPVMMKVH